jgi:hypothetical protein
VNTHDGAHVRSGVRALVIAVVLQAGCAFWMHGESHGNDAPCVDAWPSAIDLSVGIAGIAGALVWNGAYGTSAWWAAIPGVLAIEGAYYAINDLRCRHAARPADPRPSDAPVPFDWNQYAPCAIDHGDCDAAHTCTLIDATHARCMPN